MSLAHLGTHAATRPIWENQFASWVITSAYSKLGGLDLRDSAWFVMRGMEAPETLGQRQAQCDTLSKHTRRYAAEKSHLMVVAMLLMNERGR